ncbi:MAG TPA: ribokinase [Terriglobales bacterium]|nr:ribokinase [Terriglobales bacterium]
MPAPRITVVGSYATGLTLRVRRLPSRGETVLASGYRSDYGGKGSNQAVGCARLGAEVAFVASIGRDDFAAMALRLYREEGIDTRLVRQTGDLPTGVGFILVDETGHNCIALDPGANELLSAETVTASAAGFRGSAVVLTQLEIPVPAAEKALALARAESAVAILNPAPVRPLPASVLQSVDVLTPNQTEGNVLTGRSPDAESAPEEVARDLIRAGVKQVVMTLGERGALVVTASASKLLPAQQMRAVDTTGAGDAFNAGLATALAFGDDLESATRFAVITGALAVTREGVIPSLPQREEVVAFCRERGLAVPGWLLTGTASRV